MLVLRTQLPEISRLCLLHYYPYPVAVIPSLVLYDVDGLFFVYLTITQMLGPFCNVPVVRNRSVEICVPRRSQSPVRHEGCEIFPCRKPPPAGAWMSLGTARPHLVYDGGLRVVVFVVQPCSSIADIIYEVVNQRPSVTPPVSPGFMATFGYLTGMPSGVAAHPSGISVSGRMV